MQERKYVGIVYIYIFYFYATTVNIPWACYTMKIIHMGLKDIFIFFSHVMMIYSNKTFYFSLYAENEI